MDECAYMKKKRIWTIGLAVFLCCGSLLWFTGCQALEKKQQSGAAVELYGHYLYRSTLDSLTLGLSSEDSLRLTQQYISQWAKDILMYEAVKGSRSDKNTAIERMVDEYRRTLYMQAYEEYLIERRMPKNVSDSMVLQVYEQMPDRFRLDESIVEGLIVVVPVDAPKLKDLRKWLSAVSTETTDKSNESLDNIEKYVYQNASVYELFTDRWLTTTDVLGHLPLERNALETALKYKNQIEVSDSLKTYILQVTDKHLRGEQMPMTYARPEIEKMVLSARQVEFLQKERERMYNEAIQERKIVFF